MAKIKKIKKRSGAVVNFNPDRISNAIYRAAVAVGGRDRVTSERLSAQVVALLEQNAPPGYIPDIEQVQDAVEKVLIENGHARVAKAYILYREERARSRGINAELASKPSGNIPWAKIWHVLDWAASHNVHTIQHYNDRMANGDLPDIIHDSEKAYHEDVESAVEMIAQRKDELRLVIITGPSSSGKTTTTAKISEHLKRLGINLVTLNVDHYFFDLSLHPIDEFGDYDFETPQALDLHLINEHIRALIAGKEVKIPYYDFKIGKRTSNQTPMRLNAGEMILIDSLHGLYPEMTQGIDQQVDQGLAEQLAGIASEGVGHFAYCIEQVQFTVVGLLHRAQQLAHERVTGREVHCAAIFTGHRDESGVIEGGERFLSRGKIGCANTRGFPCERAEVLRHRIHKNLDFALADVRHEGLAGLLNDLRQPVDELLVRERLVQKAMRATFQRFDRSGLIGERRDDKDDQVGIVAQDARNAFDSIHLGHRQIHGHHVGPKFLADANRVCAVAGEAHNLPAGQRAAADHPGDTGADHVRVIHDEQSHLSALRAR